MLVKDLITLIQINFLKNNRLAFEKILPLHQKVKEYRCLIIIK